MSKHCRDYSLDEDLHILDVIFEAKAFYALRGNIFWKDFENLGTTTRSWQSLKERFHKKIIINLFSEKYDFPEYKKRIIHLALEQTKA